MTAWRERPQPDPNFARKDDALKAHARFIDYALEAITSVQKALGVDAEAVGAAALEAMNAEGAHSAYVLDALEALTIGLYGLIDQLKKERYCTLAAVIALARQQSYDFEKFQRDFIEAAEGLFGGPEKVPEHVRHVSMIVLGQGWRKES